MLDYIQCSLGWLSLSGANLYKYSQSGACLCELTNHLFQLYVNVEEALGLVLCWQRRFCEVDYVTYQCKLWCHYG